MLRTTRIEIQLSPVTFAQLTGIMQGQTDADKSAAEAGRKMMGDLRKEIETQIEELSKADEQFASEIRRTRLQKRRAFEDPDEADDLMRRLAHSTSGNTFIGVVLSILGGMMNALDSFEDVLLNLQPDPLMLPKNRKEDDFSIEAMRDFAILMQLNGPAIGKFVMAVENIDGLRNAVVSGATQVATAMDRYYQVLLQRHSKEGVEIHHNPVTTDIAMNVYENIDAHGETSTTEMDPERIEVTVLGLPVFEQPSRRRIQGKHLR